MLARSAFPAFLFTLAGFVLFLLVTISAPIVKPIYLLQLKTAAGSTAANVGVLGVCYSGGSSSFLGHVYTGIADCTSPKVGYTLDYTYLGLHSANDAEKVIIKGLAGSLIVNAIAAGLAGISLFFGFFAWLCSSRIMEIVLFLTLFVSSAAGAVAFFLNLAVVLVARHRINDATDGAFTGHIGDGLWLALAGAIALTLSICLAGCGMFGRYSQRHDNRNVGTAPVAEKAYGRQRFWQRSKTSAGTY